MTTAFPAAPPHPRGGRWRLLLLLVAIAIGSRALAFGNPIAHVDEEFYFVAAHAWLDGAIPFVGIWDRKPVGLFALYLPAAALGLPLGIWAYQAIATTCVVATAWLIARIALRLGWARGAALAAVAYILWLVLAEGQGGQAPVFYNLPMAAAAWLILGDRAARPWHAAAAMALVGLALQIKYSAVFEGVYFGLWILARHWRQHHRAGVTLSLAAGLVAIALAPTIAAGAGYALAGHFDEWWFANFESILTRRADPVAVQAGNLATVTLILSPVVAMAIVAGIDAWADGGWRRSNTGVDFVLGWFGASIGGLLVFGTWFDHYALPLMVPASLCAAGALAARARLRRWAVPILVIVAFGGQVLLISKRLGRGTPAQFAAIAAAVGHGPGCLWVQSGETMLYPATGRCRPTRYIFPSHLGRMRETGAIGIDQAGEVRRILASHPAVIVMRPHYRGERPEMRALVARAVARDYVMRAELPLGNERIRIFASTRAL